MIRRNLAVSSIALMAALGAQPAAAAPWVRGYVVGWYEYAFLYAGRDDYQRGSEIQPGVDCPHGNTVAFSSPANAAKVFSIPTWRNAAEFEAVANPVLVPGANQGGGGAFFSTWSRGAGFRGYTKEIQTYVNPFAAQDSGEMEVTSRIGEGFNLDGKIKPGDFVSPDGEKGIDNNLFRAWGCDAPWRGKGDATLDLRANDKMQDGLFTIVVRLSGNKDPRNDDEATMEIGYSPDKLMPDASGRTGVDYSYRIIKGAQYTKLKAKIKDGVVETEQSEIHMPQIAWFPDQNRDADFHQGKIRLVLNSDGTATGLVGGYRSWRDLFAQDTYAQDGGQQGVREHEDHIALYYALRRNADGMYNARTGQYDGISTAYRLKLADAFVVDPDKTIPIPTPAPDRGTKAYDETYAALIKGLDTRVPQPVPPDSNEPLALNTVKRRGGQQGALP